MKTLRKFAFPAAVAWALALPGLSSASAPKQEASTSASKPTEADRVVETPGGNALTVPSGWTLVRRGNTVTLTAPENNSWIELTDIALDSDGFDEQARVQDAWSAFQPAQARRLKLRSDRGASHGWDQVATYEYETPPDGSRLIGAQTWRNSRLVTVGVFDIDLAVAEKRASQIATILRGLRSSGYQPESFAGRQPNALDARRLDELRAFIARAQRELKIPGIAVGIVQDGRVVMNEGFGVRKQGAPGKVDGDTRFLIASSTKPLTTLLLGKIVDAGKVGWDTPVVDAMPGFRLGDDAITRSVQIRHLLCACTGMPREDLPFVLEGDRATPESVLGALAAKKPTSEFGALFQYSNDLAAAAGYVAGHIEFPGLRPGNAYDAAMQALVLSPLGMRRSTFDARAAATGNYAAPHGEDRNGRPVPAQAGINDLVIPVRPAGGLWSTSSDMLRYVQMELDRGLLPDGRRYVGQEALLQRYEPMVAVRNQMAYGLGLFVDRATGIDVVGHGGDAFGYHSDVFWIPKAKTGVVLLTNSDSGRSMRAAFQRRVLEVLYDGKLEADMLLGKQVARFHAEVASAYENLEVPAAHDLSGLLASRYANPELGEISVERKDGALWFDVGAWKSEMASRRNLDGSWTIVAISPAVGMFEFMLKQQDGSATLELRDAQHVYAFKRIN